MSGTSMHNELKRLRAQVASRVAGLRSVRRVIIDDGDETPEEIEGELLICRVIVDPPERPEEEIPVMMVPPSPRTVAAARMADTNPSFRRRIEYPRDGSIT